MEYKIRTAELPTFYSDQNLGDRSYIGGKKTHGLGSGIIKALHYHGSFEIGICIAGSGECYVGDRIYRYEVGSL